MVPERRLLNMLTGLINPDSGAAYVGAESVLTDLGIIYGRMGICPQHDILGLHDGKRAFRILRKT